jgi:hypothetical protein
VGKKEQIDFGYFCNFHKTAEIKKIGENSPNLITLFVSDRNQPFFQGPNILILDLRGRFFKTIELRLSYEFERRLSLSWVAFTA